MSASSSSRAKASAAALTPAGQEDVDRPRRCRRGREELDRAALHVVGDEVGLLGELALRRRERRLARHVEQAGGDLPVAVADRMPVLLDQQHALVVVDREHRDGTGVVDVLAHDLVAVVARTSSRRTSQTGPRRPVDTPVAGDGPQRRTARRAARGSTGSAGSRRRRCACTDASPSSTLEQLGWPAGARAPRRPGRGTADAARFGRDRSSGCACVPM